MLGGAQVVERFLNRRVATLELLVDLRQILCHTLLLLQSSVSIYHATSREATRVLAALPVRLSYASNLASQKRCGRISSESCYRRPREESRRASRGCTRLGKWSLDHVDLRTPGNRVHWLWRTHRSAYLPRRVGTLDALHPSGDERL